MDPLPVIPFTPAFCCCFLGFLLAFPPAAVAAVRFSNETDRLALLRFKAELMGNPSIPLSSWNNSRHFCEWEGITCGRRHPERVTALNLRSYNLVGRRISPHISNLTFLTRIDLANNTFHGVIPAEIGRLFRLRYLSLRDNKLTGEIPMNLTLCSELTELRLQDNNLSGSIPPQLHTLSKLTVLWLGKNQFMGTIPPSFGNLSSLGYLYLSRNQLEGTIPPELSQLKSLLLFAVFDNQLSGIVPPSIYNISSLQLLDLGFNGFQGTLPPNLFLMLPDLAWFSVGGNRFTGPIPVSLPNATGLELVGFYSNHFKGLVPGNLGSLQYLTTIEFSGNELGGGSGYDFSFLESLANCSDLQILDIGYNNFSGVFPDSVANLSRQLEALHMGHNMIYGSISSGIGNLINLTNLNMEYNLLTGTIPLSIGKLDKMVELYLETNRLHGEISDSFCSMTQLNRLYLSDNNLEGDIPQCLENCRLLQDLRLDNNNFKGSLPAQLFNFPSLYQILVGNNSLSGNLQLEVGISKSLQTLDVSNNNFSGEIPSSLGDCPSLEVLKLGKNRFQGVLPLSFDSLRGLRDLDVSHNHLSGKIPEYLEKLQLEYLNLSFNDFEGEVRREGIFKNASAISVIGNSKLCGGIQELHLPPCIRRPYKKTEMSHVKKAKVIITAVVLGSVVIFCLLVSSVYVWLRKSRKKSPSKPSTLDDPFMDVSYAELLKATDGFSSSNLIGTGSYGSVYKGTLHQNNMGVTTVAVKVLNLIQEGAVRSFMAECQVLQNIRHRNVIKILTCCSSIDYKGSDFKALVFEYMPNGSLHHWLSKDDKGDMISGRNLKLIERINIAIDVASALDYLHYNCQEPIVHRDLKPSNVLLDLNMVAHVGDFGLARFTSTIAQSSTVGIKGSIGYIAPEYAMGGKASIQGDVYSYGILVLEMITGKGLTAGMFENNLTLPHHVRLALLANQVIKIVDPYLLSEEAEVPQFYDYKNKMCECVCSMAQIGVACSAKSPSERMEMNEVVAQILTIRDLYLGVGKGKQTRTTALGEGSSHLGINNC